MPAARRRRCRPASRRADGAFSVPRLRAPMLEGTPNSVSFMRGILAGTPLARRGRAPRGRAGTDLLCWSGGDRRPALNLTVLGSGDAFGSGGRNQSGYLPRAGKLLILLDCGVTTPMALQKAGVDPVSLDLILLTHLHADHLGGVPILYHAFQQIRPPRRTLRIAGPPGIRGRIESIYRVLYPPRREKPRRFKVSYRTLAANRPYLPAGSSGPRIVPFPVQHQDKHRNFGYRLLWRGRELAYSGDTRWFAELPERIRGADLFLCECTHGRRANRKHLSLEELKERRRSTEVGAVLLTHLGPDLAARRSVAGFRLARDGMKVRV